MRRYSYLITVLLSSVTLSYQQANRLPGSLDEAYFRSDAVLHFDSAQVYRIPVWKFQTNGPIHATPLLAGDRLFIGSDDGSLYALDPFTGQLQWSHRTGGALFSSPATSGGTVLIASEDSLYAMSVEKWKYAFAANKPYPWKFDRFLSSPVPNAGSVYIGSNDGYMHALRIADGKLLWKFKTEEYIRSTPAIADSTVYFGDTRGKFYAVETGTGEQKWATELEGYKTAKEETGNDLQSVISSPVVSNGTVYFGCRDSYLYALDAKTGAIRWKLFHGGTWVIGSPAVEKGVVYVGTADQQYLQAVNAETGEEIWHCRMRGMVWSSPLIVNDYIYVGTSEGYLYCIDKGMGQALIKFTASGSIFSSPVANHQLLFVGSDDGALYALEPVEVIRGARRVVHWQQNDGFSFFHHQIDRYLRDYLEAQGYEVVDDAGLENFIMAGRDSAATSLVILADNSLPPSVTRGGRQSLLRKYLDNGGKVVATGPNPLIYLKDEQGRPYAFDFVQQPDSILGMRYFENDYRSYSGFQGAYPTPEGKKLGMDRFFMATCPVDPSVVSEVYATDRDGLAVAWLKSYGHPHKGFAQLWLDRNFAENPALLQQVAEYGVTWKR